MDDRIVTLVCDKRSARRVRAARAFALDPSTITYRYIMARFAVSAATAKRDLTAIRRAFNSVRALAPAQVTQ